MRIGINCQTILNPGYGEQAGVGHYTYYLIKNLLSLDKNNNYVLFFDSLITNEAVDKIVGGRSGVVAKFFPFHRYKKYLPFAYSHLLAAEFIRRQRLDVYHAPVGILPLSYQGKTMVTVHDLAIYKHPQWFPQKFLSRKFSTSLLVPQSLNKADKIIAVSKSTKKDLLELFKIKPSRVAVVHQGVARRDIPDFEKVICGLEEIACREEIFQKYNLEKKYLLFVGTIEPRKNLVAAINAFKQVARADKKLAANYKFVIAGARGWKFGPVFKAIGEANKELAKIYPEKFFIKYLGYVSHHDKWTLLGNARGFIFPSLYEGFGLPVLEAMSLGIPVITSDVSSLPEVVGSGQLLVNPQKEKELAAAISKLLTSPTLRAKMSAAGKKRAREFSWRKTAGETLKVYESLK